MNTDLIRHHARRVAAARHSLDKALKAQAVAAERLSQIDSRILETENRRAAIIDGRLAGKRDPAETAELAALGLDREALDRLRRTAVIEVDGSLPGVEAAQRDLVTVETEWQRCQTEARHAALLARVRAHEVALLKAVEATVAAGRALGHVRPRQSWMPTADLVRVVGGSHA